MSQIFKKIVVIGNGGGGKTTLSHQLAKRYGLPVTHVDDIQYLEDLTSRPLEETRKILNQVSSSEYWLIDGFGPVDTIERRFYLADKIILVDFPLWRHYWWCTKRQLRNAWNGKLEKGEGNEASIRGTIKLYKILWKVHTQLKPRFLQTLSQSSFSERVVKIESLSDWNAVYKNGVDKIDR